MESFATFPREIMPRMTRKIMLAEWEKLNRPLWCNETCDKSHADIDLNTHQCFETHPSGYSELRFSNHHTRCEMIHIPSWRTVLLLRVHWCSFCYQFSPMFSLSFFFFLIQKCDILSSFSLTLLFFFLSFLKLKEIMLMKIGPPRLNHF